MRRSPTAVLPVLLGLVLSSSAASQPPAEFKLTSSSYQGAGRFGTSTALSGDTAVVGAPYDVASSGRRPGLVRVFTRSGTTWVEMAILEILGASSGDVFGFSVALSEDGNRIAVGALREGANKTGAVYVFERRGGWDQVARLTASDGASGDHFGFALDMEGDTILVGANGDDDSGPGSGSAYVFVRSGTSWIQQAKLTASDGGPVDGFGASVALSGERALIGARLNDEGITYSGAAYVFKRSGTSWSQGAKLTASDAAEIDFFGSSVALCGDTALIGASHDDDAGRDSGSAYVFVRSDAGWTQEAKLTPLDGAAGDEFGSSVALSGNAALIGAPEDDDYRGVDVGAAYVFVRDGSWNEEAKLVPTDGEEWDGFGASVAVDGDTALVGVPGDHFLFPAAYAYELMRSSARACEFGDGCPGPLGVPVLQPAPGTSTNTGGTFEVVLSGLPANRAAFLVLGLSNTEWLSMELPMSLAPFGAPGCSLLVSGDFVARVVNTTGVAFQGFPIPPDPNLVGLHIYFQGYVRDPGASGGLTVSNGLDVIIGSR